MSKVTKTIDNEIIVSDELLKVELVDIGEGIQGDYNENDPEDKPLLRFDVYIRDPKTYEENLACERPLDDSCVGWEAVEDASYCTNLCAWSPVSVLGRAAEAIFDKYRNEIDSFPLEFSVKKLGEYLSHISEGDVIAGVSDDVLSEMLTDVVDARESFPEDCAEPAALHLDDLYADITNEQARREELEK